MTTEELIRVATARLERLAEEKPKAMTPIEFVRMVSSNHADAIWQEEWFALRAQARRIIDDYERI